MILVRLTNYTTTKKEAQPPTLWLHFNFWIGKIFTMSFKRLSVTLPTSVGSKHVLYCVPLPNKPHEEVLVY